MDSIADIIHHSFGADYPVILLAGFITLFFVSLYFGMKMKRSKNPMGTFLTSLGILLTLDIITALGSASPNNWFGILANIGVLISTIPTVIALFLTGFGFGAGLSLIMRNKKYLRGEYIISIWLISLIAISAYVQYDSVKVEALNRKVLSERTQKINHIKVLPSYLPDTFQISEDYIQGEYPASAHYSCDVPIPSQNSTIKEPNCLQITQWFTDDKNQNYLIQNLLDDKSSQEKITINGIPALFYYFEGQPNEADIIFTRYPTRPETVIQVTLKDNSSNNPPREKFKQTLIKIAESLK